MNPQFLYAQLVELAGISVRDGRWSGCSIAIVAVGEPPATYHRIFKSAGVTASDIIDCFSNAYGWETIDSKNASLSALPLFDTSINGLYELQRRLIGEDSPHQTNKIVIIDSLSPLIKAFGLHAVYALLSTLRQRVTSLVYSLHADLHPQHEIDTLCHGLACLVQLGPASERPQGHVQPHGRLNMKFRKKSGAVKTEGLDYRIEIGKGVQFLPPLTPIVGTASDVSGAQVAAQPAPSSSAAVGVLGQQVAGGMRLDVSSKEAAARAEVQLPYEHQGQGQLYASGGDFRDYLPEAAGGRQRGNGRLGHILYVRDSDSEDPDSDEDPDDDLDI